MMAGLLDQHSEYFYENDIDFVSSKGKILMVDTLDESFSSLIKDVIKSKPTVRKYLAFSFNAQSDDEQVFQYYKCNYSAVDNLPDLLSDGALGEREFVKCGQRGKCSAEGIVCKLPFLLTIKEIQVLKYIGLGLLDKEICLVLNIAIDTLRSHKDHISIKTNTNRKAQLAVVAYQLNLI